MPAGPEEGGRTGKPGSPDARPVGAAASRTPAPPFFLLCLGGGSSAQRAPETWGDEQSVSSARSPVSAPPRCWRPGGEGRQWCVCVRVLRCVLRASGEAPGRECVRARACVCVVNAEPCLTPSSRRRKGLAGALGSGQYPSVPRGSPGGKRVRDAVRCSECYTVGRLSVTAGL